jgi:competence protein ComEA
VLDELPRGPVESSSVRARAAMAVAQLRARPWRAALGVLTTLVVLAGLWWVLRPPVAVAPESLLPVVSSAPAAAAPGTSDASGVPPTVVVHVAGAVARPGVLHLPEGARVVDAVEAAGGAAPDADLDRVNLAAPIADGARVLVPRAGEAATAVEGDLTAGGVEGPLDLNLATEGQLDELPGIGPATAAAIVEYRERHGPFATVDSLVDVPGIGDAKLAQLRDLVRV